MLLKKMIVSGAIDVIRLELQNHGTTDHPTGGSLGSCQSATSAETIGSVGTVEQFLIQRKQKLKSYIAGSDRHATARLVPGQ